MAEEGDEAVGAQKRKRGSPHAAEDVEVEEEEVYQQGGGGAEVKGIDEQEGGGGHEKQQQGLLLKDAEWRRRSPTTCRPGSSPSTATRSPAARPSQAPRPRSWPPPPVPWPFPEPVAAAKEEEAADDAVWLDELLLACGPAALDGV
jgi:hypothetical protein